MRLKRIDAPFLLVYSRIILAWLDRKTALVGADLYLGRDAGVGLRNTRIGAKVLPYTQFFWY